MGIRSAFSPFGGGKLIKKGTIFFESNIPSTSNLEIELPKGRYQIVAVGAGGSGAALYDFNGNWWGGGAGASGACVQGQFLTSLKSLSVSIVVGQGGPGANGKGAGGKTGSQSKITAGSIVVTANGGGGGFIGGDGGGAGGSGTQAGLINPKITKGINGAGGGKGGAVQVGAASVYEGHGAGSNSGGYSYQTQAGGNGYVKIVYLDRK